MTYELTPDQIEGRNQWRMAMLDQLAGMGIPEDVAERCVNKAAHMVDENEKRQREDRIATNEDLKLIAEHKLTHYLYAHVTGDWCEAVLSDGPKMLVACAHAFGKASQAVNFLLHDMMDQMEKGK